MIVEINYTALHWDNHQGGSGRPIQGRLLRDWSDSFRLSEVRAFALQELENEAIETKTLIGNYLLTNIVIDP